MYQNHIRRTTTKITPNTHPQFFIRRSEFAFDPRVAYVESVCASLVESRFGPGRVLPVTVNWSDRLELESAVFSDLLDDGGTVSYWDAQLCGRCASPHVSKGETHNVGRDALTSAKFSGTRVSEPGAVATGFLNRNSLGRAGPPRCGLSGTAFLGRGSP